MWPRNDTIMKTLILSILITILISTYLIGKRDMEQKKEDSIYVLSLDMQEKSEKEAIRNGHAVEVRP